MNNTEFESLTREQLLARIEQLEEELLDGGNYSDGFEDGYSEGLEAGREE